MVTKFMICNVVSICAASDTKTPDNSRTNVRLPVSGSCLQRCICDDILRCFVKTEYNRDAFHYSADEMRVLAELVGLSVRVIGEWNHPHAQQMLVFFPVKANAGLTAHLNPTR